MSGFLWNPLPILRASIIEQSENAMTKISQHGNLVMLKFILQISYE